MNIFLIVLFLSCSKDDGISVDDLGKSTLELQVRTLPVGALSSAPSSKPLEMIVTLEAEDGTVISDTFSVSSGAASTQACSFNSLAGDKDWSLTVVTKDLEEDITIHQKDTTIYIPPADTAKVSLSLEAMYSLLECSIYPIPDSVTRCEMQVDAYTLFDTLFEKGALVGDTINSPEFYITATPEGDKHNIELNVYGDMWGKEELLYTGDSLITVFSGLDSTIAIILNWVGPDIAPDGAATITVSLGSIGSINLKGMLEQRLVLSTGSHIINDAESIINGLTFEVPDGALSSPTEFKVKPVEDITDSTFYPTLSISTGIEYANDYIKIIFPELEVVETDSTYFYAQVTDESGDIRSIMPFYKNEEGDYYTFIRSFSPKHSRNLFNGDIFESIIIKLIIEKKIVLPQTFEIRDFNATSDVWEFANNISTLPIPNGYCGAWTSTLQWYFHNKRKKGARSLKNLFDNNNFYDTPSFHQDNSNAIRFVSAAQQIGQDSAGKDYLAAVTNSLLGNQLKVVNQIASVLKKDRLAVMSLKTSSNLNSGHSVLVYKVVYHPNERLAELYIIDPNYPSSPRKITITDTGMETYGGKYDLCLYIPCDLYFPQIQLKRLWDNFLEVDDKYFLDYSLRISDGNKEQILNPLDTFVVGGTQPSIILDEVMTWGMFSNISNLHHLLNFSIYGEMDNEITPIEGEIKNKKSYKKIELSVGDNIIGVKTFGFEKYPNQNNTYYNDFRRYVIKCVDFNADRRKAPPSGEIKFSLDPMFTGYTLFEWDFGDINEETGESNKSNEPNPVHVYQEEGIYTVTLKISGPDKPELTIVNKDFMDIKYIRKETHYLSGKIKTIEMWNDFTYHGPFQAFYESGRDQYQLMYVEGAPDGLLTGYFDDELSTIQYTYNFDLGKYHGDHHEYYPDGTLKKYIPYQNDDIYGIMKTYFPNGKMEKQTPFEQGASQGLNGQLLEYYPSTYNLKREINYTNDILNGLYQKFTEDGTMTYDYTYVMDALHGTCREYFPSGKMKSERTWDLNRPIGDAFWWDDGNKYLYECHYNSSFQLHGKKTKKLGSKILIQADFNNGLADGEYKDMYDDGSTKVKGSIKTGYKTGKWNLYRSDGKDSCWYEFTGENNQFSFERVDAGNRDYVYVSCYESGNKEVKRTYENLSLHGLYIEYYDDAGGTPQLKGYYKDGKKDGRWYRYNEEGAKIDSTFH